MKTVCCCLTGSSPSWPPGLLPASHCVLLILLLLGALLPPSPGETCSVKNRSSHHLLQEVIPEAPVWVQCLSLRSWFTLRLFLLQNLMRIVMSIPVFISTISIWIPLGRTLFCPRRTLHSNIHYSAPKSFLYSTKTIIKMRLWRSEIRCPGGQVLGRLEGSWGSRWDRTQASGCLFLHERRSE